MKLSIIIPAYNCLPDVIALTNSLFATTDRTLTDVLIQDDASPDYDGPALLGPLCQRNAVNLGFAGNCRAGALQAAGDVLLFLNQDTRALTPQWDARLLATFEEIPAAGIIGPTLLFPDGRVQSVGGYFDVLAQPYHDALGYANPDYERIAAPRQVSWTTGAALAIRRELWEAAGGFDPIYGRGYWEDVDLCCKVAEKGAQIWHEPRIRFSHQVGSTGGNPRFRENARIWKARWVESGKVKPDCTAVRERFWR